MAALLDVVAVHHHLLPVGHIGDDRLGAGLDAQTAGHALFRVHCRQPLVIDMDGVEGARPLAGAQAHAAVLAGFAAAGHHGCGLAVLDALVLKALQGLVTVPHAQHPGHLPGAGLRFDAHDARHLGGTVRAADRAAVDRSLAGHNGPGEAGAAGIAAAAAVGAGQHLQNPQGAGIRLNRELLRRIGEGRTEHQAHAAQAEAGR